MLRSGVSFNGSSGARLFNPVSYCIHENINVYISKCPELDAIPCYACLADLFSIFLGQVLFVFDTHNVNGYTCCVCTYADLIEVSVFRIGILYCLRPITYIRI